MFTGSVPNLYIHDWGSVEGNGPGTSGDVLGEHDIHAVPRGRDGHERVA